ncbi:MAG: hypothetical protein FWD61_13720 [Phycisphaerales bacterium]|nr:hypothetical protein [Phycisphaerales bacterium]
MAAYSAFTSVRAASGLSSIKLLDLLTNRYHLGILRRSTPTYLQVELSGTSCFHTGQRVRFIVADDQSLVSRTAMHRGFITNVFAGEKDRVNVYVARLPETAVA